MALSIREAEGQHMRAGMSIQWSASAMVVAAEAVEAVRH